MSELIEFYCRCVLTVTVFAGMGIVFYLVLRKKNPLRALLPVCCLAVIAILPLLFFIPRPHWEWSESKVTESTMVSSDLSVASTPLALLAPHEIEDVGENKTLGELTQPLPTSFEESSPAVTESIPVEYDYDFWQRGFLIVATSLGLLTLLRLMIAGRELVIQLRNSRPIEDQAALTKLSALQAKFGISRQVILLETLHDDMPATVGWRKPVILLPRLWHDWSAEQLQAVLAHELAHVRNHDFITWLGVQIPLLLHSYHPLVHWLARRMRWEQELTADLLAVEVLGDRVGYLASLAELALGKTGQSSRSVRFSLAPNSSMLLGRLKMLCQSSAQSNRPTSRLLRVLLLTLLVLTGFAITGLFSTPVPIYAEESVVSEKGLTAPASATDIVPPVRNTELLVPKQSVDTELHSEKRSPQENSDEMATISALIEFLPLDSTVKEWNQNDWEAELQSHLAQMRSPHTMKSALTQQKVAKLSLVTRQSNPLAWLQANLVIATKVKSRMLYVGLLNCPIEDAEQGVQLVTAFIQGYINEATVKEMQKREDLHNRLFKMHKELTHELRIEIDSYESLSEELGGKESPQSALQIQLRCPP